MRPISAITLIIGLVGHAVASAADDRLVNYYKETCGTCHGEKGEGTPGLAPALRANKFVVSASVEEIGAAITKGRSAEQKRYKEFASPMPSQSMSDARLAALIAYLKNDLQR